MRFRDVYSLQSGPQQLEFGHVFEDPNVWEQRYEKKDFDAQRYQGKVSWVLLNNKKKNADNRVSNTRYSKTINFFENISFT